MLNTDQFRGNPLVLLFTLRLAESTPAFSVFEFWEQCYGYNTGNYIDSEAVKGGWDIKEIDMFSKMIEEDG